VTSILKKLLSLIEFFVQVNQAEIKDYAIKTKILLSVDWLVTILKVIFSKSNKLWLKKPGRVYTSFEETIKKNSAINRSSLSTEATLKQVVK
jgi:hypothetical protein